MAKKIFLNYEDANVIVYALVAMGDFNSASSSEALSFEDEMDGEMSSLIIKHEGAGLNKVPCCLMDVSQ